jgi:hypothetical protein
VNDSTAPRHAAEIDSRVAEGRKRLLITGSRDWDLEPIITAAILKEWLAWGRPPLTLVHGNAAGADRIAAAVINKQVRMSEDGARLFIVEPHPANWDAYKGMMEPGRKNPAGMIRNAEMVALGADLCLAFIKNNSKGASGCARLAEEAGIPVVYYRIDDARG